MVKVDSERTTGEEAKFIEYAKEEILVGLRKAQISLSLPAGVEQERAVESAARLVFEAIGYTACEEIIVGCNNHGLVVFDVRANRTPVKHQIGISNSLHLSPTRQRGLERDGVTFRSISESARLENFGATFICRFGRPF